jgi:hypothetical protein
MRRLCAVAVLVALAIGAPAAAAAQTAALNRELLKDWVELKATMIKLADAMPEDNYSFKATPAQRDFGQQVLHVATANVLNLNFLRGTATAPRINREATSKADVIKAMADSFDYGEALIKEQSEQSMLEVVPTNQFLGPSSRFRVVYFLLGHTWDIYGQMVVYLRLNGGVPPASQRP